MRFHCRIPIFKKGDKSCFNNYRPISLLPAISKVFEHIMHSQLMDYFTLNNLFYDHQYGFRKRHSTEHAILELTDRLLHCNETIKNKCSDEKRKEMVSKTQLHGNTYLQFI